MTRERGGSARYVCRVDVPYWKVKGRHGDGYNKQALIPPHTWNYHLIWSKMIPDNHSQTRKQPPLHRLTLRFYLRQKNCRYAITQSWDSLHERFTSGGDKGTAELTLHLIPSCNLIGNTDAKGTATHKQRSLATRGWLQRAKPPRQPTNLSTLTFSPLLLSYLIWAEPCRAVAGLCLCQVCLNKLC